MLPPFGWQAALDALGVRACRHGHRRRCRRPVPVGRVAGRAPSSGPALAVVADRSLPRRPARRRAGHRERHRRLRRALLGAHDPAPDADHDRPAAAGVRASRSPCCCTPAGTRCTPGPSGSIRSRVVTFLTWPPFGFAAYAAIIVATHLTGLTTLVLTNQSVHDAEHALYLVVGYLFFLPIVRPGADPVADLLPGAVHAPDAGHAGGHVHRADARQREQPDPGDDHAAAARVAQPAAGRALGRGDHVGRRRRDHARLHDAGLPHVGALRPDRRPQRRLAGSGPDVELRDAGDRRPAPPRPGRSGHAGRIGPGQRCGPGPPLRCRPRPPGGPRAAPSTTTITSTPTTNTWPGSTSPATAPPGSRRAPARQRPGPLLAEKGHKPA